jgi:nucleoside-diphosphate-sugar epimerase
MARVLVTGASGFMGRFIPALLAVRGHEVHLAGRALEKTEWPVPLPGDCFCHKVDLCAADATDQLVARIRPTHLLHLAWYAEPGRFWTSTNNITWVAASLMLFQAFVKHGGERFVGAGTCAEYDWDYHTLSPAHTPLRPSTLYGRAKASLFQLLSVAAREAGVSFAWGRIFYPFGPYEHPQRLLPQVISGLLRNEDVALSEGQQVRDFIYSEDAAHIFASLLTAPLEGATNVASGCGMSVRELAEAAARHAGNTQRLRFGQRPLGNDASPFMVADASILALEGSRVGVDEGLRRTVRWWQSKM